MFVENRSVYREVKRVYNERGPSYPKLNVSEPIAGNYYTLATTQKIVVCRL